MPRLSSGACCVIEIEAPPTITDCAACGPLIWLYSARRTAWIAFIGAPDGGRHAITPHPCRHAQHAGTWREVRTPAVPSPEYLAAKHKIQTRTDKDGTS